MLFDYIIQEQGTDPKIVGTKANNLFLIKNRVNVPEYVVVSTQAFREFKKHGIIPDKLIAEVRHVIHDVFHDQPLAVRSSGTAEDLSERSFAGMYETVLNVSGIDAVLSAIKKVWLSNDSDRVQVYRKENQLTQGEMAVILQRMLEPEISGVMVTDGLKHREVTVIECSKGLGDKIVSGAITPTRYRLKKKQIRECSGVDILSSKQLCDLYQTGVKIQKIFGSRQDIEWAYQNNCLYVLQARQLTAPVQVSTKQNTVWCNANVRETIPDPISPMGYSFFEEIWFPGIMIDAFGFPLTMEQYKKYPPVERVLGRLYWNINNSAAYGRSIEPILKITGAGNAIDPQLGQAMDSLDMSGIPALVSTAKMVWFSIQAMVRMPLFLIRSFFRFHCARNAIDRAFLEINRFAESMHPIDDFNKGVTNVRDWVQIISGRLSRQYFSGILLSVFYLAILSKLLKRRLGTKGEAIARITTYGLLDKTGEMVLAMHALAIYAHRVMSCVNSTTLNALYEKDPDFKRQYDDFIEEFGHRGPAEFDVASITWHEDPALVHGLLQNFPVAHKPRERAEMIKNLIAILPPFERYVTQLFIPRIKTLTPIRENGKHYVFKIISKVKDQLLMLEPRLIKKGFLEKKRDIFFLRLEDLEAIRDGHLAKDQARKILAARKQEWFENLNIDVPDIVYGDGKRVFLSSKGQDGLSGTPLSYGRARGRARIIRSFNEARTLETGDVLITNHTDPGWTPLFSIVSGVVIEVGGLICHAAMVARELGLPAIVLPGATTTIPDDAEIEMDADTGTVTIINKRTGDS